MTAMKTTLKATLVATAIATLPMTGYAAGLGAINVLSGLGQPLRAEIELQATPQELQSLSARVPSADAFRQSGVTFSPLMTGLQFSVETRGSRSVVRVTSDRPVNEPFMEMLVELNWAGGRLLREYTFLLDPVDLARPPVAAAPVAQPRPATPAPVAAPVRPPAVVAAPAPSGDYRVRRGDTLRGIASAHRPANVSLDQMLVALVRQNPQAFDDGNMNRLKAGAILRIPDQATAGGIAQAEARREIVAQAADFEAYRNRLSGAAAARPAPPPPAEARESTGEITARVDTPPAADAPQDRVEVTGAPSAEGGDTRIARLQALEEELVAREQSLEEANARLADLERSIRDLQRLIELRNQSLAQLQQQLAAGGQITPELLPPPVDAPPADQALADPPADAVVPMDETLSPATPSEPVVETPPASEPAPTPAPVPAPAPAPAPTDTIPERDPFAPQPSFVQSLMQDPMLLAGGGGVLALLLLYAGYKARSRRKAREEEASAIAAADYPSEGHSVFGGKGGQTVDTGSSSVLHTDFSQSGLSSIDADEGVDPVAEADVYMAYGRDAQAEEILLDALKVDSSREALYVKLLEIYAQRPSPRQFESVATEFYSKTGGAGENWAKVAEMGRKLEPENPLYKPAPKSAADAGPETEPGRDAPRGGVQSASAAGLAAATLGTLALSEAAKSGSDEASVDDKPLSEIDFTTSGRVQAESNRFDDMLSESERGSDVAGSSDSDQTLAELESGTGQDSADEFSMLDFDLGSDAASDKGRPSNLAPPSAIDASLDTRADAASAQDDDQPLHFDLDVGGITSPVDAPLSSSVEALSLGDDAISEIDLPELESSDMRPEFDLDSLNATMVGSVNDLDFESGGGDQTTAEDSTETPAAAMNESAKDAEATMLEQDFLRQSMADEPAMDLEKTEFDNDLLDFDFDLGQEAESESSAKSAEPPSLDLTSINLDLELPGDASEDQLGEIDAAGPGPVGRDAAPVAEPSPEIVQEVETKLDLARAYEEMGDKEGARELIEEVLREGSTSQRDVAKRLLERLG